MTKTKKILASLIAFAIVLTILPASLLVSANEKVYSDAELATMFQRPQLVKIIKDSVAGDVTDKALANISTLRYVAGEKVNTETNLPLYTIPSGFSKLTGLTSLTLQKHSFASLSGLARMPSLTIVDLSDNDFLTDVSYLSNSPAIATMTINDCASLTSLNGLSGKPLLQSITAMRNPKLTSVYLSGNVSLNTVNFEGCAITTLSNILSVQSMTSINLKGNKITSLSGFSNYNNALSMLDLTNNQISSIATDITTKTVLSNMQGSLKLTGNKLSAATLNSAGVVNEAAVGTQLLYSNALPTTLSSPVSFPIAALGFRATTANGAIAEEKPVAIETIYTSNGNATITGSGLYRILTPVSLGTTDVRVTIPNGPSEGIKIATINVTFGQATKLEIADKKNTNMAAGTSKPIYASVTPYTGLSQEQLVWSSSNTSLINVSSTGGGSAMLYASPNTTGSAVITVATVDGKLKDSMTVSIINPVLSISFNSPKTSMVTDETQNLTISYTPANATSRGVTYRSSNESVASVSSAGVVTAKQPGTTTITATTVGNDYEKATYFNLTVTEGDLKIKLDKKNTKIYIDQELKVTATVTPKYLADGKVSWKSDDSSVASVDSDGVITGRKIGKATISAKYSKNGETVGAYIDIEVTNPSVKIDLAKYTVNLKPEETHTIKYTVTPSDLPEKGVTFTSSNEDVAVVTSTGVVVAGTAGEATITVKSKYNSKYIARIKVTVAPTTPSLSVKKTGTTVRLAAGTSEGAKRYRYYVKTKSSDSYKRISDTTSKTFNVNGVKSDQIYYFAVRSYVTVDGKNIYSGYKKVTLNPVVATPKFTYTKSGSSVTLKVTNPPKGAKYVYYMKYEPDESFFRLTDGTTKTSYKETELVKGEYYYFTVRQYKTYDGKNVYSGYTTLKVKI